MNKSIAAKHDSLRRESTCGSALPLLYGRFTRSLWHIHDGAIGRYKKTGSAVAEVIGELVLFTEVTESRAER